METTKTEAAELKYTRKDFLSDIQPKWCPGCGDHAAFNAMTSSFANLNIPKEKFCIISGIGCSSRFPYYASTYGYHTIHGRAPTVAIGAKLANPELSVWIVTGDGDALSIGGNHYMHLMRRNLDINIIVFNNEIYGLTKGQASPTTRLASKTKTTPYGSIDIPIQPLTVALAAGATFVARVIDTDATLMKNVFAAAARHKGISVVEVLTNCIIFNKDVFSEYEDRETREERTVKLNHEEPLLFGASRNKGIILKDQTPKVVRIGENGITKDDILVHRLGQSNTTTAHMLSQIEFGGEIPLPVGIFYETDRPTYENKLLHQEEEVCALQGIGKLEALLRSGDLWQVDANGESHPI